MVSAISLLPLTGAVISVLLFVAATLLPRPHTRQSLFFALMCATTMLYSFGYFFRINFDPTKDPALFPPFTLAYLIFTLTLIGAAGAPTYWFLFGADIDGRKFWTRGWGLALAHVPLVYTLAVGLTNPWHHLFVAGMNAGHVVYGPLVRPHHLTAFFMALIGMWFAMRALWHRSTSRKMDVVLLGVTAVLPFAGSILWTTRDMTGVMSQAAAAPVLQPLANIVLGLLVLRAGLANIVPVGTLRSIMENTDSLLAYLDSGLVFVSANTAFLERTGTTVEQLQGRHFSDVVKNAALSSVAEHARELRGAVEHRGWPDALGDDDEVSSYWNWSLHPVVNKKRLQGWVFSLSEVSDEIRGAELSSALSRLTQRLHSTFNPESALPPVVASAAGVLGTDVSVLVLWENGRWRYRRCDLPAASWEPFEGAWPQLRMAIQTRRPNVVSDAALDDGYHGTEPADLAVRGLIAMPLLVNGNAIGAIAFGSRRPMKPSRQQLAFVRQLSRAMAVAVENAKLYESERIIADTLQDAMLSIPQRIEGLETAHAYRSATEAARVGGDFFDVFMIERAKVGLLIGDVSGKGIGAAAITSMVKNAVRSEALHSVSPAVVLARTNALAKRQLDIGTFVTVFFGVLDLDSGQMLYSSGGHPAPFILGRDGGLAQLEGASVVLGAFDDVEYACHEAALGRGDVILLYTDGLTETRKRAAIGEEELAQLLATMQWRTPGEVVDAVLEHAIAASDGELQDDVAVLAARLV